MDNDKIIINGYLNSFYLDGNQRIFLDNFSDRITYFKKKRFNEREFSNTEVINNYMQFIYSTLEYYIMPIVNIGLELRGFNENWSFGRNVIKSLEDCKRKYYRKTYGNLDVDNLSENHMRIIGTMKDYGMTNIIKLLDKYKLDEIERRLNARYSTIDILKVIEYLAINSEKHKSFFMEIKKKFIL